MLLTAAQGFMQAGQALCQLSHIPVPAESVFVEREGRHGGGASCLGKGWEVSSPVGGPRLGKHLEVLPIPGTKPNDQFAWIEVLPGVFDCLGILFLSHGMRITMV